MLIIVVFLSYLIYKYNTIYLWEINENFQMRKENGIIIIDNFYKYPLRIRNYCLKQKYDVHSSLYKTMFKNANLKSKNMKKFINKLECIEQKKIDLNLWDDNIKKESNGYFQFLTENDRPIIHSDDDLRTLIVFLHPNPKSNSGTAFYKNKNTEFASVSNKFNRAIIFDGNTLHCSQGGFGVNKFNSRLYQTYFYNFSL
jgi:hypothetical protein